MTLCTKEKKKKSPNKYKTIIIQARKRVDTHTEECKINEEVNRKVDTLFDKLSH
jgi:hypothetical protein